MRPETYLHDTSKIRHSSEGWNPVRRTFQILERTGSQPSLGRRVFGLTEWHESLTPLILFCFPFIQGAFAPLLLCVIFHRVKRQFKRNKEDARFFTRTLATVRLSCRPVSVGAGFENRGLLAVVGNVQLTGDQNHALRGRVPMARQVRFTGDLEEHVEIIFCGITI